MNEPLRDLHVMLEAYRRAEGVYRASPFWETLAANHVALLERWGFDEFKRTVNQRYFNWSFMGIIAHQLAPVLGNWMRHPSAAALRAELDDRSSLDERGLMRLGPLRAWFYKSYVTLLTELVARDDPWGLLSTLDEPETGHPYRIKIGDRWISQDLCNSVHEFYRAWDHKGWGRRPAAVAELGAGYGRLAYVFLRALPDASYTIVDIPPALWVAQEYLRRVFPSDAVFRYRAFSSFAEVKDEFCAARIRFLMADQIELLPPKQFDLFINVSSLHEMTKEQIVHYHAQIDRLCRGRFYSKQWRKSRAAENRFVIREHEYPIPGSWKVLRHERHPIQRWFFDALYEIGA